MRDKVRILFPSIIISLLLSFTLISRPVLGNGPVSPAAYREGLIIFLSIFILGPLIESMIVSLFLKKDEEPKIRFFLVIYFFFINFFTLPITQIVVIVLSTFNIILVTVEIIPIILEYMALATFLRYYRDRKLLKYQYPGILIMIMSIIANMVTMILGFILLYLID